MILKGIHHYWNFIFSRGLKQMEVYCFRAIATKSHCNPVHGDIGFGAPVDGLIPFEAMVETHSLVGSYRGIESETRVSKSNGGEIDMDFATKPSTPPPPHPHPNPTRPNPPHPNLPHHMARLAHRSIGDDPVLSGCLVYFLPKGQVTKMGSHPDNDIAP